MRNPDGAIYPTVVPDMRSSQTASMPMRLGGTRPGSGQVGRTVFGLVARCGHPDQVSWRVGTDLRTWDDGRRRLRDLASIRCPRTRAIASFPVAPARIQPITAAR